MSNIYDRRSYGQINHYKMFDKLIVLLYYLFMSELQRRSSEIESVPQLPTIWEVSDTTPVKYLAGVHLGRRIGRDGWNAGYVDRSETPLPELGFSFGVAQASYGYTGIFAKPLGDHTIEALKVDSETGAASWVSTLDGQDEVTVTSDWGTLSETDWDDVFKSTNFGLVGGRLGIIRVRAATGAAVSYYALGADFQGEPDDWRVTGSLIEIIPISPLELGSVAPTLPAIE